MQFTAEHRKRFILPGYTANYHATTSLEKATDILDLTRSLAKGPIGNLFSEKNLVNLKGRETTGDTFELLPENEFLVFGIKGTIVVPADEEPIDDGESVIISGGEHGGHEPILARPPKENAEASEFSFLLSSSFETFRPSGDIVHQLNTRQSFSVLGRGLWSILSDESVKLTTLSFGLDLFGIRTYPFFGRTAVASEFLSLEASSTSLEVRVSADYLEDKMKLPGDRLGLRSQFDTTLQPFLRHSLSEQLLR